MARTYTRTPMAVRFARRLEPQPNPLEGDNLATHATGARLCRTCLLAAKTRYNRKARARDTA
jgi:hypothetical protein